MPPHAPSMPLEAQTLSIRTLFALGQFEPARLQRDYQWEEEHWHTLLVDLLAAFKDAGLDPGDETPPERDEQEEDQPGKADAPAAALPAGAPRKKLPRAAPLSCYYLGHMLLMPRQAEGRFYIYDGQQRLTTLTLLLCALRENPGEFAMWNGIQHALWTAPPNVQARLDIPTYGKALKTLLRPGGIEAGLDARRIEHADERMFAGAKFFAAMTRSWAHRRWQAFAEFLLDNVFVTVTRTRDRRVLEYAYMTINMRGKPLDQNSILKGHFVQLGSRQSLTAATQMATHWDRLEKVTGDRLGHIMQMALLLDFNEAPVLDFATRVMDHFDDEAKLAEAEHWISQRLPDLAKLHATWILEPGRANETRSPITELRRMSFLPWRYWQAIVFAFAERDKNEPKRFALSIAGLERWAFLVNLIDVDDTWILNNVVEVLEQISAGYDPLDRRTKGRLCVSVNWKKRAKAALRDGQVKDKHRRAAQVRWIETLYWPVDAVNFLATNDSSVEHVLPRRPNGQWLEDFKEHRHIDAERFGNYCLIPRKLNDDLSNGQYAAKRAAYQTLPPHFRSANEVASVEMWTPATLAARTAMVVERAERALLL